MRTPTCLCHPKLATTHPPVQPDLSSQAPACHCPAGTSSHPSLREHRAGQGRATAAPRALGSERGPTLGGSSIRVRPGLCDRRPRHRRLLALAACLIPGTGSLVPGTGSNAALQCFEISSDVMNLSNLRLLFNCLPCQAKSVINEFTMGKKSKS